MSSSINRRLGTPKSVGVVPTLISLGLPSKKRALFLYGRFRRPPLLNLNTCSPLLVKIEMRKPREIPCYPKGGHPPPKHRVFLKPWLCYDSEREPFLLKKGDTIPGKYSLRKPLLGSGKKISQTPLKPFITLWAFFLLVTPLPNRIISLKLSFSPNTLLPTWLVQLRIIIHPLTGNALPKVQSILQLPC